MAAAGSSGGGGSSAVRAGRAFVELSVRDAGIQKSLDRVKAKFLKLGTVLGGVGAGLAGVGGGILGGLGALFKGALSRGDDIQKLATRLGSTAEEVSGLAYAADLSGASMEEFENGLRNMQRALAAEGGGGGSLTDQLGEFADKLAGLDNPAQQTALAMETFGRAGTRMLPFLKSGRAGIAELTAEAKRNGSVMSGETAAAAEKFSDTISKSWTALKNTALSIGEAFLPLADSAEEIAQAFINIGGQIRAFIKNNQTLVQIVAAVAAGVAALGTVLIVVGGAFALAGFAIGGLATAWAAVTAVFWAVISPIGLIVIGITAVGASVAYLLYEFTSLGKTFSDTWGGIAAAVGKGDLKLAMNIAWAGIKVVWHDAIAELKAVWIGFKYFFLQVGQALTNGFSLLLAGMVEKTASTIQDLGGKIGLDLGLGGYKGLLTETIRAGNEEWNQLLRKREAELAATGTNSAAARAELAALIAEAKKQEAKTKAAAAGVARAAAGSFFTGTVQGGFGNNLSSSLAIGSNRTIADNTKKTADNTEKMAKALEGAGPLVWAA